MHTRRQIQILHTIRQTFRHALLTPLISVLILGINPVAMAKEPENNQNVMYAALVTYGIALVSGITEAATGTTEQTITGNQVKDSLNTMVSSYQTALKEQKAAVGMLDATFELAFTAIDVSSGGASLVATAPARWVKSQAMEGIKSQAEAKSRKLLAANLDKFKTEAGLDYDSLKTKSPGEIKQALDKVGILSGMRTTLGKDSPAVQLIENATIDALISTDKSILDDLAAQGHCSAPLKSSHLH